MIRALAREAIVLICVVKDRFLSKITPRKVASFVVSIGFLFSIRSFLALECTSPENISSFVFFSFKVILDFLQKAEIWSMDFWSLFWSVSRLLAVV